MSTTPAPSHHQQKIVDRVRDPAGGSIVVEAVPGSGKTTLLTHAASAVPATQSLRVVCFGKAVAQELKLRMPKHARTGTLNGLGLAALMQRNATIEVDGNKSHRIITYLKSNSRIDKRIPNGKIAQVVGLMKSEGLVPANISDMNGLVQDTTPEWLRILDHYSIDTDPDKCPLDKLMHSVRMVLTMSIQWAHKIIDFNDQLYIPTLTNGFTFPKTDWVFVDEAQDVSSLQRDMILRACSTGRLLAVGDSAQAIYGWRGADVDSMEQLRKAKGATRMTLPVCWRCPTKVLDIAREIVPIIEAAPGAPEGIVEHHYKALELKDMRKPSLVVCRNKAPMVGFAYKLIKRNIPCRIIGRNIGQETIGLVLRIASNEVTAPLSLFHKRLESWSAREISKALRDNNEARAEEISEQRDVLRAVAEAVETLFYNELEEKDPGDTSNEHPEDWVVEDKPEPEPTVNMLCESITKNFSNEVEADPNQVSIGTIHAVKGLEADYVYFLDSDLIPSKNAKLDWQRVQEQNLRFVAVTRARKELHFIYSNKVR